MGEPKWFDRVSDWVSGQVAEAATDIRRRVVEEPWFGKPLDGPQAPAASAWDWSPDERATEELQQAVHEFGGSRPDEPAPGEHERGIDR